eukprot:CAMPEP_0175064832 /NCGR_PEP_ID=MMETSP0052_2-20121109/15566_1 /TAXON_ID=51329 ORGANISM="Polytomella parva, Strain SAG 63-3" /NCGR_SAMPLE_ID=MMETSP0052_2 /ASSEMBLY_ACC=CAM_ASM_000194 /LENGTH=40 /DNA_ID= /DNA_START= /DNA_END= /DNA_ORIENTATION=
MIRLSVKTITKAVPMTDIPVSSLGGFQYRYSTKTLKPLKA